MDSFESRRAILILKEEVAAVLLTLQEAVVSIDKRCDEALAALASPAMPDFDEDDEEMGSQDSFINDEPESVESSSSSSLEEAPLNHDDDDDDDDDDLVVLSDGDDEEVIVPPLKRKKAVSKITRKRKGKAVAPPPAVKPQSGKRIRKKPRRFSPTPQRVPPPPKDKEELSASDERYSFPSDDDEIDLLPAVAAAGQSRLDRDQWNVVRRQSTEQRNRNPWWSRRFATPINQVRQGLGPETANNRGPRELWDAMGLYPETVEIEALPVPRTDKCGFCGGTKTCTHRIYVRRTGDKYYLGAKCVHVAKAWHHMAELLGEPQKVELFDLEHALQDLQSAHVAKAERNKTRRYQ